MRLLVVLAVAAAAALPAAAGGAAGGAAAPPTCASGVRAGAIPRWARSGFSAPNPRLPHAVGRHGRIAALIFGYPLRSPPAANRTNKILWVERRPSAGPTALWIRAQRFAGRSAVGAAVTRIVPGGPGPSIVDLPQPGCWRLTLTWSGRTDTLDLRYLAGR